MTDRYGSIVIIGKQVSRDKVSTETDHGLTGTHFTIARIPIKRVTVEKIFQEMEDDRTDTNE
jgi:nitrogen regulatory protein PII-like uncharacterized protein